MKVELNLESNLRIIATNEKDQATYFDASAKAGGDESAPSPMEVMLECVGGCTFIDVMTILRKKRVIIDHLKIEIDGDRSDSPPKVFTKAVIKYILTSPNATLNDLEKAVQLSQDKYCGASAMFKKAGCEVSWSLELISS